MNERFTSLLITLLLITPLYAVEPANEQHLDDVAERGVHVMPFDLEKTMHFFTKTTRGGIQQVIVKDKLDTEQIRLIRAHLREISIAFANADFSRPAQIHGDDMPGLAELRSAQPGQIKIEYEALANGAQIIYTAKSPSLVQAIHRWFDAQLSDHARHAAPGQTHPHH
ncbi:hypothetical protein C8R30_10550 [Nitrosomonas nitrosa]|uniref:aspartate carbamoyltransferase n=1 Tax=Nitrosomonas nitrosa TaxID=52442 RepID=UPI000D30E60E|nr:aspartate carbamoyltransferase [Nitrosomonas nitrosa]PTR02792.1 hypothetical protein C8R30_10550 [Nitrosomonas nitrosa]